MGPVGACLRGLCGPCLRGLCGPGLSPLLPSPDMVKLTKAKTFQAYLDSCHRRYSCVHCRAHLANHDDLISKVSPPPAPLPKP